MLTLVVAVNLPWINPAMPSVGLRHCRKKASSTNMSRCSFRIRWSIFIKAKILQDSLVFEYLAFYIRKRKRIKKLSCAVNIHRTRKSWILFCFHIASLFTFDNDRCAKRQFVVFNNFFVATDVAAQSKMLSFFNSLCGQFIYILSEFPT